MAYRGKREDQAKYLSCSTTAVIENTPLASQPATLRSAG